jgi:hypothetical protein
MNKTILLLVALVIGFFGFSQGEIKEGIITTTQTMSSDNEQMNAQLALMGNMTSTTYFKGDKSRTEISNPMSGDIIAISDGASNQTITFMNNPMLGKKYMKGTMDVSEEDLDKMVVEKGEATKTILGYECQQYFITANMQGNEVKGEVYTTEAINAYSQEMSKYKGKLKGYPLFMVMNINQMGINMNITYEVTEIKKESVSDDKFSMAILEGYDEMKQN